MRIYYDLIVWEEIDETDTEKLMTKFGEFAKRLQGFGIVSWKMRAGQQQQQEATPEEIAQYNAEQEALAESEQAEPEPEQEQEQPQITETNPGVKQEVVEE